MGCNWYSFALKYELKFYVGVRVSFPPNFKKFLNYSKILVKLSKFPLKKKKEKSLPIFLFKNNNKFGERNQQLGYDNNAHAKEPIWGVRVAILHAIQQQKLNHNCETLVLSFALH